MSTTSRGIILIGGRSGAGKTALVDDVFGKSGPSAIWRLPSTTTRPRRESEGVSGVYNFVDKDDFEGRLADGKILEWTIYDEHYYGTAESEMDVNDKILLKIAEPEGIINIQKWCVESGWCSRDQILTVQITSLSADRFIRLLQRSDGDYARRRMTEDEWRKWDDVEWDVSIANRQGDQGYNLALAILKSIVEPFKAICGIGE